MYLYGTVLLQRTVLKAFTEKISIELNIKEKLKHNSYLG